MLLQIHTQLFDGFRSRRSDQRGAGKQEEGQWGEMIPRLRDVYSFSINIPH